MGRGGGVTTALAAPLNIWPMTDISPRELVAPRARAIRPQPRQQAASDARGAGCRIGDGTNPSVDGYE